MSHTGALPEADRALEAASRRAGLLRVRELSDLFSAAKVLAKIPSLNGERLAIITNGGDAGVLAADRLSDLKIEPALLSDAAVAQLYGAMPAT